MAANNHDGSPCLTVDTHCHLFMDPLVRNVPAALARAAARGVHHVIVPAYDPDSWQAMTHLVDFPQVSIALGLHPWAANQAASLVRALNTENPPERTNTTNNETTIDYDAHCSTLRLELEAALTPAPPDFHPALGQQPIAPLANHIVAIGEIGLDYKIDFAAGQPGPEWQLPVLRTQLELAADRDLPVILHCRGAFKELLDEVNRFGGKLRGVLHAYSRGEDPARSFIKAGLHIGLGGAITRDRAKRVRQAAVHLPLDKILLETDAPSIGLDGVMPVDTEPGHVRDVAETLAALRGETLETIAEVTTGNARELFRLPV
jgi:TatD DNase family protein